MAITQDNLPTPQPLGSATADALPAPVPIAASGDSLPAPVALNAELPAPTPLAQSPQAAQPNPALAQPARAFEDSLFPAQTRMAAGPPPSVWQRIKNIFLAGNPNYSTRTASDPKYGEMQLISPEEAMTPAEQAKHPILTGAGEFVGGLTSPPNVALLAGTGALGELPGAAGRIVTRLMSAGFGMQALYGVYKQSGEFRKALAAGDYSSAEKIATEMVLQTGAAALGLKHAATGKAAVTGAEDTAEPGRMTRRVGKMDAGDRAAGRPVPGEAPQVPVQVKPVSATSPLGEVLAQPESAPDIRIVDSAAAKQSLEHAATVVAPAGTRIFHGTTGDVESIEQLNPEQFSKVGAAGIGAYLSESPEQASHYTPQIEGAGGRVLGGTLSPDAKLLDANKPLPADLWNKIGERLNVELPKAPQSYLQVIKTLNEESGDKQPILEFQKIVSQDGDYSGVKYEHAYPSGVRQGIMLFGEGVAGRPLSDILKPDVPSATVRLVDQSYVPVISQDEVLNEAVQRAIHNSGELQKAGLDPSKIETGGDVQRMLDGAASYVEGRLDPRVNVRISFPAQRALAEELGMTLEDLLSRRSGESFNAEKSIAARSLLRASQERTMNLARLAAMGDESYQTEFVRSLAQHQEILRQVEGVRTEAGRALGSLRIPESQLPAAKVTDLLAKLPPESAAKAAQLLSRLDPEDSRTMNQAIAEITPSDTPQRVWEGYRNALLSSPATLIKKVSSDTVMLAVESLSKLVKSGIDPEAKAGESFWFMRGAANALAQLPAILSGKLDVADAPDFEQHETVHAIKGIAGKIVRFPTQALSAATNLAYLANLKGELYSRAFRQAAGEGLTGADMDARIEDLVGHPSDDAMDAAHKVALRNTFQKQLGKAGRGFQQFVNNSPMKWLLPFVKTPLNLFAESVNLSPLGLAKGAFTGDADAISRGIIGTVLLSGIAYEAAQGNFTGGGPLDWRKKATMENAGFSPYSFKIGGRYYNLHKLEPFGLSTGAVADVVHGMSSGDPETVGESKAGVALSHLARNASSFPFLMTVSNALEALEGNQSSGSRISNFVDREFGSLIPAAVANVAEATDPTVRHPEGLAQTLESRTPGMTQRVPPALDIAGKPVRRSASEFGGAVPFYTTKDIGDPVARELVRLGVPTPAAPKSVKLRGEAVALTAAESQAVASAEGQEFTERLGKIMQQPSWAKRSDAQKRTTIRELRQRIDAMRPGRVNRMREQRASTLDMLGRNDAQARSL